MARDLIETRGFRSIPPTDAVDPPKLGQVVETAKDAFVEMLREFLSGTQASERISEVPTVEKYATGLASPEDPFATTVQILEDMAQRNERLPHIAVVSASGRESPLTVGRPLIAVVQHPPRVETSVEPFAIADAVAEVRSVTVDAASAGDYTVTLNGYDITFTASATDTINTIAGGLANVLAGSSTAHGFRVGLGSGTSSNVVTLTHPERGVPFTLTAGANMTVALVQAAGAMVPDALTIRTAPDGRGHSGVATEGRVELLPEMFRSGVTMSAVTAAELAEVLDRQFRHVRAMATNSGAVRLTPVVPTDEAEPGHDEVEVLFDPGSQLATSLSLASAGSAGAGDSIGGVAPNMTLTVGAAPFDSSMVGRYVTLAGQVQAANDGRYEIVAVDSATTIRYHNPTGVPATLTGSWFVGARDDTRNPSRPKMLRYHVRWALSIRVEVLAESPPVRTELLDLIVSQLSLWMEHRYFTLLGRGVTDETYPDEVWQITLNGQAAISGESEAPRPGEGEDYAFVVGVDCPVLMDYYVDRPVVLPSGQGWTLEAENGVLDEGLPLPV